MIEYSGLVAFFLCALSALAAGGCGAVSDFRRMRIANIIPLVVLGAFFLALGLDGISSAPLLGGVWWSHLVAGVILFGASYLLFAFCGFGGGDSKLLTAFGFWVGLKGLPVFLFYVTISGAILALLALLVSRWKPFKKPMPESWVGRLQAGERNVPYGIAIVAGACVAFGALGYLDLPVISGGVSH